MEQNLQSSHLPDAGLIAVTNQLHYILRCVKLDYSVVLVVVDMRQLLLKVAISQEYRYKNFFYSYEYVIHIFTYLQY